MGGALQTADDCGCSAAADCDGYANKVARARPGFGASRGCVSFDTVGHVAARMDEASSVEHYDGPLSERNTLPAAGSVQACNSSRHTPSPTAAAAPPVGASPTAVELAAGAAGLARLPSGLDATASQMQRSRAQISLRASLPMYLRRVLQREDSLRSAFQPVVLATQCRRTGNIDRAGLARAVARICGHFVGDTVNPADVKLSTVGPPLTRDEAFEHFYASLLCLTDRMEEVAAAEGRPVAAAAAASAASQLSIDGVGGTVVGKGGATEPPLGAGQQLPSAGATAPAVVPPPCHLSLSAVPAEMKRRISPPLDSETVCPALRGRSRSVGHSRGSSPSSFTNAATAAAAERRAPLAATSLSSSMTAEQLAGTLLPEQKQQAPLPQQQPWMLSADCLVPRTCQAGEHAHIVVREDCRVTVSGGDIAAGGGGASMVVPIPAVPLRQPTSNIWEVDSQAVESQHRSVSPLGSAAAADATAAKKGTASAQPRVVAHREPGTDVLASARQATPAERLPTSVEVIELLEASRARLTGFRRSLGRENNLLREQDVEIKRLEALRMELETGVAEAEAATETLPTAWLRLPIGPASTKDGAADESCAASDLALDRPMSLHDLKRHLGTARFFRKRIKELEAALDSGEDEVARLSEEIRRRTMDFGN